jgi:hypothetical protein
MVLVVLIAHKDEKAASGVTSSAHVTNERPGSSYL